MDLLDFWDFGLYIYLCLLKLKLWPLRLSAMPLYYILCRVLQTTLTIFLVFDMMVGQCHSALKIVNSRGKERKKSFQWGNPEFSCFVWTQNQILLKIIPNKTLQKIIKSVVQISKVFFKILVLSIQQQPWQHNKILDRYYWLHFFA